MAKLEKDKILICVTGYPGSGKSVFASVGKEFGLKIFTMGDIVREEARKKYGVIDKYTLGKVAEELREKYGDDAIALLLSNKIEDSKDRIVIVDGIRSMREVKILSKIGRVYLIAILAKRTTRYRRLVSRGRADDMKTYEDFLIRENRERSFGIAEVIENSDIYIYNEDIDLETFIEISKRLFNRILDEIHEKEKN